MNSSLQHSVFQILSNWEGSESLKELFWRELNYDRLNQPLPRRDFPKAADDALVEDPLLFAESSDFHILYCRLMADRLRLTDERAVVNHLLQQHPYALFVFSDRSQTNWHFVNVKEGTSPPAPLHKFVERGVRQRRRLFRRIAVGPEERLRTAAERIAMLDVAFISPSPLAIQQRHDEAFDVEAVTKAFFDDYQHLFADVKTQLQKQTNDAQWAHDYALQMLNRLMFLYFIQRKRWLGNNPDFIGDFWDAYKSNGQPKDTFFSNWITPLFFEAFNNKFQAGRADRRHFPPEIRSALALAPYLNGGLFSRNELDDKYSPREMTQAISRGSFTVPDAVFEMLFDRFNGQTPGFLERYNFTIREDSPFDQEVAVDPEMIGKVYESLVNIRSEGIEEEDRRGTAGIFYTPRIEIDLMCRLALVDWLANHLGEEHKPLLYEAVFAYEPDEKQAADEALLRNDLWKELNNLLRDVTVLDPACGSGSFLIGMLTVLDDLQARANKQLGIEEDAYTRCKRIIGQNLYGVDVMPWAVHVAELRLWLQLMVETEIHPSQLKFRPLLPNLSFKVRPGDSLVQEVGGINLSLHRTSLDIPKELKGRLTRFKGEKLKFYNSASDAKYRSEEMLKNEERAIFNDILFAKQHALENEIQKLTRLIESPQPRQVVLFREMEQEEAVQMELKAEELKRQREERQQELEQVQQTRSALRANQNVPFVWDIAFVEIFEGDKKGFDIVIGNPPYVRQEKIADPKLQESDYAASKWRALKKEYKDKLRLSVATTYPKFFDYKLAKGKFRKLDAKSDLYVYFYLHGLSLLNPKGSFCFITSNSWLDVGYGKDLQEFLLKHSHVKMILDNQAKRSFEADVNTIIALLSPPDDKRQWGFDKTARFVMFKTPFEDILSDILSPVIFQEIEEATERVIHPEFRVCALRQRELYEEGLPTSDEEGRKRIATAHYEGNKWGGKYLHAPDIFFTIFEKGKGKLVRLGEVAHVETYLNTGGADGFFIVKDAGLTEHTRFIQNVSKEGKDEIFELDAKFVVPFIKSPNELSRLIVRKEDAQWILVILPVDERELTPLARSYIHWGEQVGFSQRSGCRNRRPWWKLPPQATKPGKILWNRIHHERHLVPWNPQQVAYTNFYGIWPKVTGDKIMVAILNSTLLVLVRELMGRTNFGGGALKTEGIDIAKFPVINPQYLSAVQKHELSEVFRQICCREVHLIFDEISQPDRRALDNVVFDALGLTAGEREAVYEAVVELVRRRLEKAKSV